MSEITLNGIRYQVGRLDAKRQFHIARRLAPALAGFVSSLGAARQARASGDEAALAVLLQPVLEATAKMAEQDVDYVINHSLSVVSRFEAEKWMPVTSAHGGLMYQDIDMPLMARLVFEVLAENLSNFSRAAA